MSCPPGPYLLLENIKMNEIRNEYLETLVNSKVSSGSPLAPQAKLRLVNWHPIGGL
jgi:hypothetical protein